MIDRDRIISQASLLDSVMQRPAPVCTAATQRDADRALAGEIHFMGDQYIAIGRANIDWTSAHNSHHVWQSRPKRFLYLPPLMTAFHATGDERYAEAARDYLEDWMRAHPASPDWTMPSCDNGLNLGIRLAFFAEALAAFDRSVAWDVPFMERLLQQIVSELRFIGGKLSPKGNFRMKQAMSLLECGIRLDQLPEAEGWRRQGVAVMNDAARRQLHADGVHGECNPTYHSWMARLFGDCLLLQREWPELGIAFTPERIAAMHDYSLAATRPNGALCAIHDSEGAWEDLRDNAAMAARSAFRRLHGLTDSLPPTHQLFPVAGQVYMRDGWGTDATYLTFDATRWGGAHCHLSRNTLQLHALGRSLLVDTGRISYEMSDPLGPYAKSTRAHSTLNLNGWSQFTTNPDQLRSFHAPGFDCVSSRYSGGYWPAPFGWWFSQGLGTGIGAVHARHVLWVHGRACVVIDEITRWRETGRGPDHETPSLEVNWQLSPGTVSVDAANRRAHTNHDDANLLIHVAHAPVEAELEVHAGELDPPRGWVRDPARPGAEAAPQLSLVARPWQGFVETIVTVLVPYAGTRVPELQTAVDIGSGSSARPSTLTLSWGDGITETLCWMEGLDTMLGSCEIGDTDGTMYYRRDGGNQVVRAAVDATYADTDSIILFSE